MLVKIEASELEVRKRKGLPVTIYRPSVVVGDSKTGVTQKFDGPYFVIRWILRQPRIAFLPVVGRPKKHRFNVVPRDFIIDAIDFLTERGKAHCYQLADPEPLTDFGDRGLRLSVQSGNFPFLLLG